MLLGIAAADAVLRPAQGELRLFVADGDKEVGGLGHGFRHVAGSVEPALLLLRGVVARAKRLPRSRILPPARRVAAGRGADDSPVAAGWDNRGDLPGTPAAPEAPCTPCLRRAPRVSRERDARMAGSR